jgi:formylmethanofuran dehydrogenase subunit E
VNTPTPDDHLDRCVAYHGHLCIGQALGVRLALQGMELVGATDPKQTIVFVENDRCIVDAIQIVTGTRLGRRSAKLINYGKMAATFLNTKTGVAYRVSVRSVPPASPEDKTAARRILRVPSPDLLAWQKVKVSLRPEDLPGRPRRTVNCARCGEKVFDGRDIPSDGGPLCVPCARGSYYEVVEDS